MNFKCERLSITDDPDFGCTIQFLDSKETNDEILTIEKILHPQNKYVLIQRSYPEDDHENDWYLVESSESDTELNYLDKIIIKLRRELIEISWSGEKVTIGLDLSEKEYLQLENTLKNNFKQRIILL